MREDSPEGEELEICPADEPFGFMVGESQVLLALEKALLGKTDLMLGPFSSQSDITVLELSK